MTDLRVMLAVGCWMLDVGCQPRVSPRRGPERKCPPVDGGARMSVKGQFKILQFLIAWVEGVIEIVPDRKVPYFH